MVGKLRFKTNLFEGVLDGGEDSVFVDNNKFNKMMETVSELLDEKTTEEKNSDESMPETTISIEEEEENRPYTDKDQMATPEDNFDDYILGDEEPSYKPKETKPSQFASDNNLPPASDQSNGASASTTPPANPKARKPQELVAQGVSFLSSLAETLKSPEATQRLVDSIVQKDETTGETSIKIPVESKETVSNLLGLLGKLFAQ